MAERRFEIVVPRNQTKERLDKFLVQLLPDTSRSRCQKLIDEGNVRIDGNLTKAHHLILSGEKITITIPEPTRLEVIPEDIPLDILYEDQHLLVVNKKAGMVVHPAFAAYSGTLVNAILYHCKDLSGIGGVQRPGIVHRLDKDTSGLLVVAKDDQTHRELAAQFAHHEIERKYWAVAWGSFPEKEGRIETAIGRSRMDRTRMTTHVAEGKHAVTRYEVLRQFPLLSLVKLHLETGRTHQIRVHLSSIGHPVFGDPTYGGRQRRLGGLSNKDRQLAAMLLEQMPRQALHAKVLGFLHPVKKEFMRFDSNLPEDIQGLLQTLENLPV